jgi:hypothetical protein
LFRKITGKEEATPRPSPISFIIEEMAFGFATTAKLPSTRFFFLIAF